MAEPEQHPEHHPVEVDLTVTDADGNATTATEEKPRPELVEVTLTITDEQGDTMTQTKEIPAGPTQVAILKQELGVPDTETLFLLREGHKPKVLADHETHDVKAGDHYEVVSKGGAS